MSGASTGRKFDSKRYIEQMGSATPASRTAILGTYNYGDIVARSRPMVDSRDAHNRFIEDRAPLERVPKFLRKLSSFLELANFSPALALTHWTSDCISQIWCLHTA